MPGAVQRVFKYVFRAETMSALGAGIPASVAIFRGVVAGSAACRLTAASFSGGGAAQSANFRRLRSRRIILTRWMLQARAERPTASSNPSEPRSRIRFNPRCSSLLVADSASECFLRAASFL